MIPSNKAYKNISLYYDKTTNLEVFQVYKKLIGQIKNKKVLDLGCGTGTLLKFYSKNNETWGIDGSPEMIKMAKTKDKKSKYKVADIRDFKLKNKFDLITCCYDTINHLPSINDWQKLFKAVSLHLNEKGAFIFDYNTEESLLRCAGTVLQKMGKNYVVRQVKNDKTGCSWKFHNFVKEDSNLFKLQKSIIKEKSYPNKLIEEKVSKYFWIIKKVNSNNNRIYIKATKKAA